MLQAYIDESEKNDVFVMAGWISEAERWAHFSDDWQKVLDSRSPHYKVIHEFKASEMRKSSKCDMEQSGWFYNVIEDHAMAAFSVMFPISSLRNALHRLPYKTRILDLEKLENPYYFGFRATIDLLMQNQVNLGLNSPIDFIFDEKSEHIKCLEGWDAMKLNAPPERAALMGSKPAFKNSKSAKPLQAADLYAGWVRHWANQGFVGEGVKEQRFPWQVKNEKMPRLVCWWNEEGLYDNLKKIFDVSMS
jgi:hypothetical protein